MNEPQHTPGPWSWPCPPSSNPDWRKIVSTDGAEIASVPFLGSAYETIANARLIAAAPDLLDALQRLHRLSGQLIDEPSSRITKALASAAIYKATATNTASK